MGKDKQKTKYFIGKVRSVDPKTFTAEVVISDETKDRYDERVKVDAFKKTKKDFMKHPVLLSSHAYRGLMNQLGMFTNIKIDEEKREVIATPKWFVGEGNAEADWGWKLAEHGIAAFSIGFIPKKTVNYDEETRAKNGGIWCDYEDIELLEVSQVLIPANPSALQKSFGKIEDNDLFMKELSEKIFSVFKDSEEKDHVQWEEKEEKEKAGLSEEEQKNLDKIENKKWDETDSEIRHRVRDPENFEKFRSIKIKKDKPKVNAIYGKLKGKDEWQIQALRFPKEDGWTMESAKAWVKDHPDIVKFLEDVTFEEENEVNTEGKVQDEIAKGLEEVKKYIVDTFTKMFADHVIKTFDFKGKKVEGGFFIVPNSSETEQMLLQFIEKNGIEEKKEKEENTDNVENVIGEEKYIELKNALFGEDKQVSNEEVHKIFSNLNDEVSKIFSK